MHANELDMVTLAKAVLDITCFQGDHCERRTCVCAVSPKQGCFTRPGYRTGKIAGIFFFFSPVAIRGTAAAILDPYGLKK